MVSRIIDIYKRIVSFEKQIGIIKNGDDNLYSERTDRYINNSVTAKTCARIMATYLTGKGWGDDENKLIVDKGNKTTLLKFTQRINQSVSKYRGVYIHVKYNGNFEPSAYKVLNFNNCRLGVEDDDKYVGKIGVSSKYDAKNIKTKDINFVDVFNIDKDIVKLQMEAQADKNASLTEMVSKYKGQILYVNLDEEYLYPLSQIDPVINDCDSEAQTSIYKNRSLRKGYMGQKLIITKPMTGGVEDYDSPEHHQIAKNDALSFVNMIEGGVGAENQGGVMVAERSYEDDSLDDLIKVVDIGTNLDDKMFAFTEESVFNNILMSFNSIPSGLVRPVNTLFGASSAAIQQMQLVYQDNTSTERNETIQVVQFLMSVFMNPVTSLELELLVSEEPTETDQNG